MNALRFYDGRHMALRQIGNSRLQGILKRMQDGESLKFTLDLSNSGNL